MAQYIDADILRNEIERRIDILSEVSVKQHKKGDSEMSTYYHGKAVSLEELLYFIDSIQQEHPIKVYRVENEKEQKGLWRRFDGTWEPLFDMLTDGQCKDMPMDDSPIYREGGKQWFASAPSKETLQKWFSKRDLEELTTAGFTITEFEILEYRKLNDFEYIFTRESIVNKTNINVADIYPKEQLKVDLKKEIKEWVDLMVGAMFPEEQDGGFISEVDYRSDIRQTALHFYELGLNAKKEE